MKVGNKFFMQERDVEGVENFPAHKTGIVLYWYSVCTQRYKCVHVLWCMGPRTYVSCQTTLYNIHPLCIWSYYCENMSFLLIYFLSVQRYTHTRTLLVVMVSEVCEGRVSAHAGWYDDSSLWAHSLSFMKLFMRANLKRERETGVSTKQSKTHYIFKKGVRFSMMWSRVGFCFVNISKCQGGEKRSTRDIHNGGMWSTSRPKFLRCSLRNGIP